jgi:magnesium-transporting ATPase (P-type)
VLQAKSRLSKNGPNRIGPGVDRLERIGGALSTGAAFVKKQAAVAASKAQELANKQAKIEGPADAAPAPEEPEEEKEIVVANITRSDLKMQVDCTTLVPGDIWHFGTGEVVPADCRILRTKGQLTVDLSPVSGKEEDGEVVRGAGESSADSLLEAENVLLATSLIHDGSGTVAFVGLAKPYFSL